MSYILVITIISKEYKQNIHCMLKKTFIKHLATIN